jgi:hypothetical protein
VPYYWRCSCDEDGVVHRVQERYEPQPGDYYFGWTGNFLVKSVYIIGKAGPPTHGGIVVVMPDGCPKILEATTVEREYRDRPGVFLRPVYHRLSTYDGPVWVRRLRCPLTAEQSQCLTDFALTQAGKKFPRPRAFWAPYVFSPNRGPLVNRLFGAPRMDRSRWFCTELMMTAAMACGILNPNCYTPAATFPRDMFLDELLDLSPWWDKPVRLHWEGRCD